MNAVKADTMLHYLEGLSRMIAREKYCVQKPGVLYSRSVTKHNALSCVFIVTTRANRGRDAVHAGSIGAPGESFTSSWRDTMAAKKRGRKAAAKKGAATRKRKSAARKSSAKKGARTRKRKTAKRSAAAKKGARKRR